jgi:hypothetical protein
MADSGKDTKVKDLGWGRTKVIGVRSGDWKCDSDEDIDVAVVMRLLGAQSSGY